MTQSESPPITGDMIKEDRKRRKIKSRGAYRELTGLSESAQARWENPEGKRKPGEYEILARFIFDPELGPPQVDTAVPAEQPEASPAATDQTSGEVPAAPPAPPVPAAGSSVESPPVFAIGEQGPEVPAVASSNTETPEGDGTGLPVELVSGEDLDDPEVLGDNVVTPGSGLPVKMDYKLPGYHITNSELGTFKRCRRMWYLAYYREMKIILPDLTGARSIGTRLHLALAAHYSTRHEDPYAVLEETLREDRTILEERGDAQGLEDLAKDGELARIMLEGYFEWVTEEGKDQGIEVIGDEVVVEELLGTAEQFEWDQDVILMGKMDLIVKRYVDNALMFMDHKSVGSLKEPLKTLHMNEQMLQYMLLLYLLVEREKRESQLQGDLPGAQLSETVELRIQDVQGSDSSGAAMGGASQGPRSFEQRGQQPGSDASWVPQQASQHESPFAQVGGAQEGAFGSGETTSASGLDRGVQAQNVGVYSIATGEDARERSNRLARTITTHFGGTTSQVSYVSGGLYNMLRKVKRTTRANPPFFDRVEVPHNQYELQSYWMRIWGEVTEIITLRKKLDAGADHRQVAYPTPTGNCSWDCDFISVCPLFDDGSDAERMLGDLYEKGGPHDYYLPYGESAVARQEGSTN